MSSKVRVKLGEVPETVQTPVVEDVNVTASPESDDAVTETEPADSAVAEAPAYVIVCAALGVTEAEVAEFPLVPPLFAAVAVKVYDVPLTRPETVQDPDGGVPVGLAMLQV